MKGKYLNLIISLQLAALWVNSLSQRATLRMNVQFFQLLSQGYRALVIGQEGDRRTRFWLLCFFEAMDVIHLPAVSLCMNCWGFKKTFFPYVSFMIYSLY